MAKTKSELIQSGLAWIFWCAAVVALYFGVFWLVFLLTFVGGIAGGWAALRSNWKQPVNVISAIINLGTFTGLAIGWLVLSMAGYV